MLPMEIISHIRRTAETLISARNTYYPHQRLFVAFFKDKAVGEEQWETIPPVQRREGGEYPK